jgi:phosphopentomutase
MGRCIILMFDSFGIGGAADAGRFGDQGADTLGHIAEWFEVERKKGTLLEPFALPYLARLGLSKAHEMSIGHPFTPSIGDGEPLKGAYTYAAEKSTGKDTLSGHWELAGYPVMFNWGYFPDVPHCFPQELISGLIEKGNLPGVLGEKHASGTVIIQELGDEHIRSGKPIVYTSADSVLQIAAHEKYFGLERLYKLCEIAFELVKPYKIARVIARPFVGEKSGEYTRTGNRHDYAVAAPEKTLLDRVTENGGEVHAVGKIADIFAHRGITKAYHATGLSALFDATLEAMQNAPDGSLVFTNFVDFDSSYGHRRDVKGYGEGLMLLDRRLPELEKIRKPGDLFLITADHGCDPTWKGTDHTREHVPMLFFGDGVRPGPLVPMKTYGDAGQIIAQHLGITLSRGTAQEVWVK